MRVFSSAQILERYDTFTVETIDGIYVILKGFMNKTRTMENGFPSDVSSQTCFSCLLRGMVIVLNSVIKDYLYFELSYFNLSVEFFSFDCLNIEVIFLTSTCLTKSCTTAFICLRSEEYLNCTLAEKSQLAIHHGNDFKTSPILYEPWKQFFLLRSLLYRGVILDHYY